MVQESKGGAFTGPDDVQYKAKCQNPNCEWTKILWRTSGIGWKVGDMLPPNPEKPEETRCVKCGTYSLMIIEVPQSQPIQGPKGFWCLPTT